MIIFTIAVAISAVTCLIINRINTIFQITNNTIEDEQWYFYPLTYQLTTTIVLVGMALYICFQILLVLLLANALIKVRLLYI